MSSASGIRAGRAYVELGANDSKLVAGLRSAQARLNKFGKSMALAGGATMAAGAAVLGPMLAASNVFASSGDELSKAADKTGITVEALSELRHAAGQSAVDFKAFGSAINKQQRNLAEAAAGNKTARESFDNLGLSVESLMALSPDQQFEAIADKISKIDDPAKRTAAAMDIFGKSGADLMPLMTGGAAGIEALRNEAKALGLQVSGADAKNATLLGDTWANVQATMMDVVFEIGAALAPALISIMQYVTPLIVGVSAWISENRQLIVTVAGIAAAVMAGGAALVGLGGIATGLAAAIGMVISMAGTIATVLAAVISPVGILIGLAVGLTYAFLQWTETGQAVLGWFSTEFGKLTAIVTDTVGGIFNAIKGGRLDLAAEIAFTGIKLAMATIMESVLALFGSSIGEMMATLMRLYKEINKFMARLEYGRQSAQNWLAEKAAYVLGGEDAVATARENGAMQLNQDMLGINQADNWDPAAAAKEWSDSLDPASLEAKLKALSEEAGAAAASAVNNDPIKIAPLEFDPSTIETAAAAAADGRDKAQEKTSQPSFGTFSAQSAILNFAGGTIQQRQLEIQQKIEKNTRDREERRARR